MNQKKAKQIRKIAKMLVYTSPDLEYDEKTVKKANQLLKSKYKRGTLLDFLKGITRKQEEEEKQNEPDISASRPL